MQDVITRDGRVLSWPEYYAEQVANELADPADCIPYEVCDCPPRPTLEDLAGTSPATLQAVA